MILSHGGINWTWYTQGEMTPEGFRIDKHWRLHDSRDYPHPVPENCYAQLMESDGRIVTRIRIGDTIHPVINPKHVFSYDQGE